MANNGKTIYLTCREMAGLTRERAAELLSCGVRTLARWELGEALPPNDIVYRMFTLYPNGQYLAVEHLRNSSELGAAVLPAVDPCDLPTAAIRLINRVMEFAEKHRDRQLLQIAEDGMISDAERPLFDEILKELDGLIKASTEVKLATEPDKDV